jgi:hypothetical protein
MPPDIRHVVFLMQENQSFDRMLGWLGAPHDVAAPGARMPIVPRPDQDWLGPPFEVTWGPGALHDTLDHTSLLAWLARAYRAVAQEEDPDALSAQVAATVERAVVVPDPEEA